METIYYIILAVFILYIFSVSCLPRIRGLRGWGGLCIGLRSRIEFLRPLCGGRQTLHLMAVPVESFIHRIP